MVLLTFLHKTLFPSLSIFSRRGHGTTCHEAGREINWSLYQFKKTEGVVWAFLVRRCCYEEWWNTFSALVRIQLSLPVRRWALETYFWRRNLAILFLKKTKRVTFFLRMVLESYNYALSDAKITFKFDGINLIDDFLAKTLIFKRTV